MNPSIYKIPSFDNGTDIEMVYGGDVYGNDYDKYYYYYSCAGLDAADVDSYDTVVDADNGDGKNLFHNSLLLLWLLLILRFCPQNRSAGG